MSDYGKRNNGMRQFGKKSPKKAAETLNQIAIRVSKAFLGQLIRDGFFSGEALSFTPELKQRFNVAFQNLVSKNGTLSSVIWPLVIDHISNFSVEAFRFKQSAGALSWSEAAIMLEGFNWTGQP